MTTESSNVSRPAKISTLKIAGYTSLALLAASYLVVRNRTAEAQRLHPPRGNFIEVDGVRLHYLEQGNGPVLVLLHGNLVRANDYRLSGLLERLAQSYRVIAFDRPGFGYSERPRSTIWTAEAQSLLLRQALKKLGVDNYMVLAHSWGTLVAVAMGLQEPELVRGLVLISGYYYPSARLDVPFAVMPAIPLLGTLMRYTTSPLAGRLLWPLTAKSLFSPHAVSPNFKREDPWMLMRPSQVRAMAGEAGLMVPMAAELQSRYPELKVPVVLIAGEKDKIVDPADQSARLHRELKDSTLTVVPGVGHMVHYSAQDEVLEAVDDLAVQAGLLATHANSRATIGERRPAI